jgi:hypothetical protein
MMPRMALPPCPRLRFLGLALALGVLAPRAAAPADDPHKALRDAVLRTLEEKDATKRAEALKPLEKMRDPLVLEVAVEAGRKLRALVVKLRAEQAKVEQAYEKTINDANELDRKFRERNDGSERATEAFNKKDRKISEARDAALATLRDLENEFGRLQALLDGIPTTVTKILGNLEPGQLAAAFDLLERAWFRSPDPQDPVWFVDAVGGLDVAPARERVRKTAANPNLLPAARGVALANLAAKRDESLPGAAIEYLTLGPDAFALTRAAVAALARVHRVEGIEPLIAFLGREDIGVLRDDARAALQSLTGQKHGPYRQPWDDWWKAAKPDFRMPPDPAPPAAQETADKGVTFYGVTTLSDRIVFLLDISGSMDKPAVKERPEPDRLTVAKKELLGAISRVDDGDRFAVILFNHEILPWQAAMTTASEDQRRKVKEWVEARGPRGGTNLHDALEAAFAMAAGTAGAPAADTIFFMTDGTPTAGKLQKPDAILDAVRDWNRTAHLTIHCIAVGEADTELLKAIAQVGNGQFIQR